VPVDPICLAKRDAKFSMAWTRAEALGDCQAPGGDEAAIEAAVDDLVDMLRGDLVK
jgi:hypothetical protein